jgi:hypothetical protein
MDDRAHDLAITADGLTAAVKTQLSNVVVQNLNATFPTFLPQMASNGNPLNMNPVTMSLPSDSVVISGNVPPFTAITIGTTLDSVTGRDKGIIDFISLPGGVLVSTVEEKDLSGNPFDIRPMDLKLIQGGGKVWVRFEHEAGLTPGSGLGQAAILYNLTGTLLTRFAASGDTFRLDDIEIGSNAAISISESSPTVANQQVVGHVQLIHF